MTSISLFIRKFIHHFVRISWRSLLFSCLVHLVIGYLICLFTGQSHLIDTWHSYLHFWLVTISTVGYGDLYAQGAWQRVLVDIWFIGLGLGLFGSILGKTAEYIFQMMNRHLNGMRKFSNLDQHIILFCNDVVDSKQIIKLLLDDEKRQKRSILLCTTREGQQHPFPDSECVEFAKLSSFLDEDEMQRIALKNAARIIIQTDSDDENLALTVHVAGLVSKDCHVVTHFEDENHIESIERLNLRVECSSSKKNERLVRASQDHGSMAAMNRLLSIRKNENGETDKDDMTLYTVKLPNDLDISFGELKQKIYTSLGADALGIAYDEFGESLVLLPKPQTSLQGSSVYLHYMSNQRLDIKQIIN